MGDNTTNTTAHTVLPCRRCGSPIVFLRTSKGTTMPVDAETVSPGDTDYAHGKHTSHFATCPHAAEFRKPRK